jgi:hypothetical protein
MARLERRNILLRQNPYQGATFRAAALRARGRSPRRKQIRLPRIVGVK